MTKSHLKRINTPKTWKILRKNNKFVSRPAPGAQQRSLTMSINTVLKEMIGIASTKKEVKHMLHSKQVLVNGHLKYDEKNPVGFTDVISLPTMKKAYVITIDRNNHLIPIEIKFDEANKKIAKVRNKTMIAKDKMQVNLHDGHNVIIPVGKAKIEYGTGDSVVVGLPGGKIEKHIKLEPKAQVLVYKGKHTGELGEVKSIENSVITIKTKEKEFTTNKNYVITTGKEYKSLVA